jgi:hypothetical protein
LPKETLRFANGRIMDAAVLHDAETCEAVSDDIMHR